jgi:DNA-binding IscR family transcriptional regulator
MDAKLQSVILEYGAEGYGLYWYCLELIAANVDPDNLSFELEHDARIIARNLGMGVQRCEDIMKHMVNIGLFEASNGRITCLKLAKRADDYTAKLVRSGLSQAVDLIDNRESPTNSDNVQLDKNRLDKNRIENKPKKPAAKALVTIDDFISKCKESGEPTISPDDPILTYAKEAGIPQEFIRLNWLEFIERNRESGKKYKDWRSAFRKCVRGSWYKLWWLDGESYLLSTNGKQAEIKHKNSGRL